VTAVEFAEIVRQETTAARRRDVHVSIGFRVDPTAEHRSARRGTNGSSWIVTLPAVKDRDEDSVRKDVRDGIEYAARQPVVFLCARGAR